MALIARPGRKVPRVKRSTCTEPADLVILPNGVAGITGHERRTENVG